MIIFDLDGTLADCEHRRHFIDPLHPKNLQIEDGCIITIFPNGNCESNRQIKDFKPDWKSFYEACDKDVPIEPVITVMERLSPEYEGEMQIWTGRCESVRAKTNYWLMKHGLCLDLNILKNLKMRPIGDNTPLHELKERWLDELKLGDIVTLKSKENLDIREGIYPIDFVFDSDPKSIEMWKRRGVFVFNCCQ